MFTPDVGAFAPARALASVLGEYALRYNGSAASFPLPDDTPPMIPRVVLQSLDNVWRINAAPARMDSFWGPNAGLVQEGQLHEIVTQCSQVLEHYVQQNGVRVGRLALVMLRGCEAPEPARYLVEKFCNEAAREGSFRHSRSFEIHNHKQYIARFQPQSINSWVRLRTAQIGANPAIAVEQDINTLEEGLEQNQFDPTQMRRFFTDALEEMGTILRVYFPEEIES